jgi:S-adenosylmethionine hydrolase
VAAALSRGSKLPDLGKKVDAVMVFQIPRPEYRENMIKGNILHIDNFGNLITNIKESTLKESSLSNLKQSINIMVSDCKISGLVNTYAGREGPIALFGSSGYLEISLPNANIARFLKARVGNEVLVKTGVIGDLLHPLKRAEPRRKAN